MTEQVRGTGLASRERDPWALDGLLFGVTSHDGTTFIAVMVSLGAIALAAAYLPARRAVGVPLSVALGSE